MTLNYDYFWTEPSPRLDNVPLPGYDISLYCNTSTSTSRPYLTQKFRNAAFHTDHDLPKPAISTIRLAHNVVSARLRSQTARTGFELPCSVRRTKSQYTSIRSQVFAPSETSFEHVHAGLVCPLSASKDFRFLLTCIGCYYRWPKEVTLETIDEDTMLEYH